MLRDAEIYAEPERFMPERWIDEDGTLRHDLPTPDDAFGFGRRICPGRYFAMDFTWLAIAHILTVFRIERALDEYGQEIVPEADFTPKLVALVSIYPIVLMRLDIPFMHVQNSEAFQMSVHAKVHWSGEAG